MHMATPLFSIRRHFGKLKDPRVLGRSRHLLIDVVAIAICGTICGCQDWQQIETWAQNRRSWLERFLALQGGIPSHDTLERVFERLEPGAFQKCFRSWTAALADGLKIKHIAIDGKTMRGSGYTPSGWKPLHLVSAWASEHHLSLGEVAIDDKSNEITAIPRLLDLLDLNEALVTVDAIGCQKDIAAKIVTQGGDYVLTVKDNQPKLAEAIGASFLEAEEKDYQGYEVDTYETFDKGHGREERRSYKVMQVPEGQEAFAAWPALMVIGMCYSERSVAGQTSEECRFFIGSRKANARTYGMALRNHWGIENNLHWQLDVSFGEDNNRVSRRNGGQNLASLRKLALTLLKRNPDRRSIACKQVMAMVSTDFLEQVLSEGINVVNI
jgi:predicted transposase YbfD/YdcC